MPSKASRPNCAKKRTRKFPHKNKAKQLSSCKAAVCFKIDDTVILVQPSNGTPAKSRDDFDTEDEYVRWYVLKRDLSRPPHALLHLILWMMAFAACVVALAITGLHAGLCGWSWLIAVTVASLLFARILVVAAVKVYQRYTPDSVRRNCILLPTCSEYCILAVRKYGAIRGCCKTLHRLFHTCVGNDYREDWP